MIKNEPSAGITSLYSCQQYAVATTYESILGHYLVDRDRSTRRVYMLNGPPTRVW